MTRLTRWGGLIALSALLTALLTRLHLPAATLLAPMAVAVGFALTGRAPRLHAGAAHGAQGLVGLLIAGSLPPAMPAELAQRWPVILAGTCSTILLAALLGWGLSRSRLLPGTTAIWGAMPGAASVITLVAQDFGADMRLVAFMQYLRVALVALAAALVARAAGLQGGGETLWFPATDPVWLILTVVLGAALAGLGQALRVPGGSFLLPMLAGLGLIHGLGLRFALVPWLMALAYALIGWTVGLRFTPETLGAALRAFPRVLAALLALIAACGLAAGGLVWVAGIDPLTAYLATSPGGADSVAIIATQVPVDVPFVMTMQMSRFLLILFVGPALARALSRSGQKRG